MKKILFVCTGNTCRSPMAEGYFNEFTRTNGIDACASSAGIFVTEACVSNEAKQVMLENGIDISAHIPNQLDDYMIAEADVVLAMTENHKKYLITNGATSTKVFTLAQYVGENIEISDPYGGDIDLYRKTFDEIKGLIEKYVDK